MNEASTLQSCGREAQHASDLYVMPARLGRPMRIALVGTAPIQGWLSKFLDAAARMRWLDVTVLPTTGKISGPRASLPCELRNSFAELGNGLWVSAGMTSVDARTPAESEAPMDLEQLWSKVSALQPDLILLSGPESLAETLAKHATWGCWNFDASLAAPTGVHIPLLAPMPQENSATAIALELLDAGGEPITLVGGWSALRGPFWRHRKQLFRKLPAMLTRALHRLAGNEFPTIGRAAARLRLGPARSRIDLAEGTRAFANTLQQAVKERLRRLSGASPTWFLVLPRGRAPLDPDAPAIGTPIEITAPQGYFWADPCLVDADGRRLLYVEEAELKTGRGLIACLELHQDRVRRLGTALAEPHHLSFPQVFRWEGAWYMTVESGHDNRASLYRASSFPLHWKRFRDLLSGQVCIDPVLHHHRDGRWYLFANIAESGGNAWDELFLFVAENLTGPFRPHPANPIVSDVRRARPAGRLFAHGERLIRPAQDCAPRYGSAIVFNEILELSPHHYRERPLSRLAPGWADQLDGCHTYSAVDGVEVLDVHGRPADVAHGRGPSATQPERSRPRSHAWWRIGLPMKAGDAVRRRP